MSSTQISATWVGVPSKSRTLGKLEPGETVTVAVSILSSPNYAADADQLAKATVGELDELAKAVGVAPVDGPKAAKVDALAATMKARTAKLPRRTPSRDEVAPAAVVDDGKVTP